MRNVKREQRPWYDRLTDDERKSCEPLTDAQFIHLWQASLLGSAASFLFRIGATARSAKSTAGAQAHAIFRDRIRQAYRLVIRAQTSHSQGRDYLIDTPHTRRHAAITHALNATKAH
jgi:hypothetical protein